MTKDEKFMKEAIKEAKKAYLKDEVPVGSVVVVNDKIIARGHNTRQSTMNSLGHAEMIAVQKACKKEKHWIMEDATIYVTVEPCLMCCGIILQSRFHRLVYGTNNPKGGCVESILQVFECDKFNHKVEVEKGICHDEIETLMKDFFKSMRQKKHKQNSNC